jgi:kumamolisin
MKYHIIIKRTIQQKQQPFTTSHLFLCAKEFYGMFSLYHLNLPMRLRGLVGRPMMLAALVLALSCGSISAARSADSHMVALVRSVPSQHAMHNAHYIGRVASGSRIQLSITLPLRNQDKLTDLLRRLYTPGDPLYGKYLTSDEFNAQFAPTQADYDAVVAYAQSQGLTIIQKYTGRTVLAVSGSAQTVENALGVHLNQFSMTDGRIAYANDAAPQIPKALDGIVSGVVGLDNISTHLRPYHVRKINSNTAKGGHDIGTGPTGGLVPSDMKTAFNLSDVTLKGDGQILGLYELDGYTAANITKYTAQFGLPAATLVNVPVDGGPGTPGDGETEVELDIEMMTALAPNAKTIYIYEGANGTAAQLDGYTKIADDNLAKSVSTSWGIDEADSQSTRAGEAAAFQKMNTQGQSLYAAAGDDGAFDDPNSNSVAVDDPASQPFVTGVGGTSLKLTGPGGTYVSESTWNDAEGAGGGGISSVWSKPDYQIGFGSSGTQRDVPDVSLNADPETGYDIYTTDTGVTGWERVGGTSAAAPLWAAFTALVNQQRAANPQPNVPATVGFANPQIYAIGKSTHYGQDFHDINDGSSNLFYTAITGYDDATGWGTFIGDNLLTDLANTLDAGGPPGTLSGTVTDSNGKAVNVTVTVSAINSQDGSILRQVTADNTGAYTMSLPSGLIYNITADALEYEEAESDGVTITAGQTTKLNLTLPGQGHVFSDGTNSVLAMISAPFDYSTTADFASIFGLTGTPTGNPRLYIWDPIEGLYVVTPNVPADTIRLGDGYWIRFPVAATPWYIHRSGVPAPPGQPFYLALKPGWNQIGDPFPATTPISSISVFTTDSTVTTGIASATDSVVMPLYLFDGANYQPVDASGSLQQWQGYWIHALQPCTLVIPDPSGPPIRN